MSEVKDLETVNNGLIERFNVSCLAPAIGAYKHIVSKKMSNDTYELEISGLLSLDENGNFVSGDCKEQTLVIFNNLSDAIVCAAKHYNITLDKKQALNYVTSTLVLLDNMGDFPLVNQAYEESGMPFTCRAAFAVKELPLAAKGALVEIRVNVMLSI